MDSPVRVRFAPSPTGHLHIGGARTALFNWAFARARGGTAILRIEDTDRERSTEESIRQILEAFEWLGMEWDEGPHRQTERLELYREAARKLLASGAAYRCTCTPEELDAMRERARGEGRPPRYDGTCRGRYDRDPEGPFVVRLLVPDAGETVVEDLLAGPVRFEHAQLDDFVLVRSDGSPTYNFCVVVDDIEMRITHVIRGNDHLANTPKQVLLYRALGAEPPRFAHISMILGSDRKRLSKRHGATSVLEFREEGYLPEALVNYLVRLGWSLGDQEVFSREEIVRHFDIANLNRAPALHNPEKLLWLNAHYIKGCEEGRLTDLLEEFLRKEGLDPGVLPREKRAEVVRSLLERAKTLREMARSARYFFTDEVEVDPKAAAKFLTPETAPALRAATASLRGLEDFGPQAVRGAFERVLEERGLKLGELAQPLRVALTGGTVSPGIYEVVSILGKERVLRRLERALARIGDGGGVD